MKIKSIAAILFLVQSLAVSSQAGEAFSSLAVLRGEPGSTAPAVPAPQAAAAPVNSPENPAPLKEWTVMYFINGSNNLAPYFLGDAIQIAATGESDDVNVAMEYSVMPGGEGKSYARRLRLTRGEGGKKTADVYGDWENRDMGDWRTLADFVSWARASFPARRYMLVVQNHGGGFVDETVRPKNSNKGISYDDVSNNYIKTPELARVLAKTGRVDLLVLNACEMQMAEVAYEIGSGADVLIASEELDRTVFFQPAERLEHLKAFAKEDTGMIAAGFIALRDRLVEPGNAVSYVYGTSTQTYVVGKDIPSTLSAVRTSELALLPGDLDRWTAAVMEAGEEDAVKFAVAYTMRLGVLKPSQQPFSQFTDLYSFVRLVDSSTASEKVRRASSKLFTRLEKIVAWNSAANTNASGVDYYRDAHGLGIKMIPLSPVRPAAVNPYVTVTVDTPYADLRLSKDSSWDEFLAWVGQVYYRPR
jgi:hypothetical protein